MIIAIGMKPRAGPWGGGNRFVSALAQTLTDQGHRVVFSLERPDIDLALLTDPRKFSESASFQSAAIWRYLSLNPSCLVVHRVNECDERKGTAHVNKQLRHGNLVADHTVFISSWLRDLHLSQGWPSRSHDVILNGADQSVFHGHGAMKWDGTSPYRLVTHHWGTDWRKGFDVYAQIDEMLNEDDWMGRLELTYVGNLPKDFVFRNVRHLPPLNGDQLAAELRRHHAYLSASLNEPAGMHHIEGACCGLPVLFRNSGALPEYCEGFGIGFNGDDFAAKLEEMMRRHDEFASRMVVYPNTAQRSISAYVSLFERLVAQRQAIMASRSLWSRLKFPLQGVVVR